MEIQVQFGMKLIILEFADAAAQQFVRISQYELGSFCVKGIPRNYKLTDRTVGQQNGPFEFANQISGFVG